MFKRLHDVDKWDRPWYRKLTPVEKCAWDFITSKCDNVGVWIPDFEIAEIYIGASLDWKVFTEKCNDNITVMTNGKWWIIDFCRFQYAELREDTASRPLLSYIATLKKHGLWKAYLKGIYSHHDNDHENDIDIDNIKSEKKAKKNSVDKRGELKSYGPATPVMLSGSEYSELLELYGKMYVETYIKKMSLWEPTSGKRHKDDYKAMLRWMDKDKIPLLPPPPPKCPHCGTPMIDGCCRNKECPQYN
jgi:hypothetical protein